MTIIYQTDLANVNWEKLKASLKADNFDNGRTPEQYKRSAENSYLNIFAYEGERIVGNMRVLSDGVCNAYIVDVWTQSEYRHRGIASEMMRLAMSKLNGQHVYLFTDEAMKFYETLGFKHQDFGMGCVVGKWLVNG